MAEIIYVLINAGMPTLTRVGVLADGGNPSELDDALFPENIPLPYECIYACTVKDSAQAKGAAYEKFAAWRLGPHGDFADVMSESIVEVLRPYEVEDVTASFSASFDSPLTEEEKDTRARYTALRRPGKVTLSEAL
jgi:hypothetical protein